jgi:glyoxylase-like metal-dependent hydrolase (beta-lactamase superfamily II)
MPAMRPAALTVLLLLSLSGPSLAAGPMPAPQVVKVNERVYALLGPVSLPNPENQGYMVNSTLILGDRGAILIDSGFSREVGDHLARTIKKITPLPVTHVVNTHHHGDHVFGNVSFKGAEILSSENCKKSVIETGAAWLQIAESAIGRKLPGTVPMPATRTYAAASKTAVTINGVAMEFWVPEAAHTTGDMLVWLPQDRVLVAGDVIVNTTTPVFRDGVVAKWVQTLQEAQQYPAQTIVPGHGPLMTPAELAVLHKRMADFYAGVERVYKAGLSESDVRAKVDLREWASLKSFDEQMGGNINRTWLEVEAANF